MRNLFIYIKLALIFITLIAIYLGKTNNFTAFILGALIGSIIVDIIFKYIK